MKNRTAKEWEDILLEGCYVVEDSRLSAKSVAALLVQIQLDAFKAGMTEAVNIADTQRKEQMNGPTSRKVCGCNGGS